MKIIYLIIAGGSSEYESNYLAQRNSCFAQLPSFAEVIWVKSSSLIDEIRIENEVLLVPGKGEPSEVLEKTIKAVEWINQNRDYDFLIRGNTSNFFSVKLCADLINQLDFRKKVLYGKVDFNLINSQPEWYLSGAGIYMNKVAAQELCNIPISKFVNIPEDDAITEFMLESGYDLVDIGRCELTSYSALRVTHQVRLKSWTSSQITNKRFIAVNNIYNANSSIEMITRYLFFELREIFRGLFTSRRPQISLALRLSRDIPSGLKESFHMRNRREEA